MCILCSICFKLTSDGTAQRPACSSAKRRACCLVTFDLSYCVRCAYGQAGQRLKTNTGAVIRQIATSPPRSNKPCRSAARQENGGRRKRVGPDAGSQLTLVRRGGVWPRGQSVETLLICWFDPGSSKLLGNLPDKVFSGRIAAFQEPWLPWLHSLTITTACTYVHCSHQLTHYSFQISLSIVASLQDCVRCAYFFFFMYLHASLTSDKMFVFFRWPFCLHSSIIQI